MSNVGSVGVIRYLEEFLVDDIHTGAANGVAWYTAVAGGATAFAQTSTATYGHHIIGIISAADDDLVELCYGTLNVYGATGYNAIEVLFSVDTATDIAWNIGFNDDVNETSPLPVELATTTWTTNADTFVGLAFDVDATNDNVHCMWVDATVDSTESLANLRMSGASLTAAKWAMARVELQDRGSGNSLRGTFTYAQDGKSFTKEFNTNVNRATALCPYIGFESRAATANNARVKYVLLEHGIPDL